VTDAALRMEPERWETLIFTAEGELERWVTHPNRTAALKQHFAPGLSPGAVITHRPLMEAPVDGGSSMSDGLYWKYEALKLRKALEQIARLSGIGGVEAREIARQALSGITEIERAIWAEYAAEHPDAPLEPDHWPQWLIGAALAVSEPERRSPIEDAAAWIAYDVIGNELHGVQPIPASLRPHIAKAMVEDSRMGWPDLETAELTLDEWEWVGS
jgi:hypothetical protein